MTNDKIMPCSVLATYEADSRLLHRSEDGSALVVVVGGCFDILHPGHLHTLEWAKAQGDILVVLVNDDAGVTALKGSGRPVLPLHDRLQMLAALEVVDYVTWFEGIDAVPALLELKPSLFVKGSDYGQGCMGHMPECAACRCDVAPPASFHRHTSDLLAGRMERKAVCSQSA